MGKRKFVIDLGSEKIEVEGHPTQKRSHQVSHEKAQIPSDDSR
ncbi:hypothetical protein DYY67_1867 [Candidatus Nitrosotalea sp. TS]|nr:hypothetical protein [Candidatus Nitrosotalea sp. TS]NHI02791.1 hypothetical protein [Candidatus Nitrosotalea sp. TS]